MIPINKRRIGACIILSLITFGIYSIYWEYLLVKNTRAIQKDDSSCTGEMFCLIFVPFYSLYWWFTRGKLVRDEFSKHGFSASSNETAFLVLALFGLGIVAMAIMQNDFNSLPYESTQSDQRSAKKIKELLIRYKSVILYIIFGGLTTVIDWGVTFVLYYLWGDAIEANNLLIHGADVIAWVAAVLFAFVTNRIWVFESKKHGFLPVLGELIAFAGGRVVTLLLQEGMIALLFTWLGLNKYLVKVLAAVVVIILNYFISKLFVFRKKKDQNE